MLLHHQQSPVSAAAGAFTSLADWCSSIVSQGHVPRLEELEALQGSPHFVSELLPVLEGHPSPEVRLLAAMCLKNLVRASWRFKLTPEDKSRIREAVTRPRGSGAAAVSASTQLAVTAGLIARLDWPERWPDLLPRLNICLTTDTDQLPGLLLLHHVVKALMSKTLPRHRQQFRLVSCDLVPALVDRLLPQLQMLADCRAHSAAPAPDSVVRCATLTVKCCANLITHGLAGLRTQAGSEAPLQLLLCSVASLPSMLPSPELEPLTSALGRLLLRCQAHASQEFSQLLEPVVRLAVGVAFAAETEAVDRDRRVVIQCLNLLSQCVLAYATPGQDASESLQAASRTLDALLNDSATETLVWGLLQRHFTLTPAEIDEALNSPADAVFAQTPEQAHHLTGRHAAEALLQALLRELPNRALAAVQRVAQSRLSTPPAAQAPPELEATLALLAACPYDLAKCVRFPDLCAAWALPLLMLEAEESAAVESSWRVLVQRRALVLLAAWVDVPDALPSDLFGLCCSLAARFMDPGRHPLLRLQAARLAHALLTSLSLDAGAFEPHARDCFRGLAALLTMPAGCGGSSSDQTQVQLLGVIASFLRYSVADLRPCLPALVPHLPAMWAAATGDQARLAVLSVLCELAKLGDLSLGRFAVPLAHACLTGPDLFWEGGLHLLLYLLCHLHAHPSETEAAACLDGSVACLQARIRERGCMEAAERRLLQVCAYLDCDRYLRLHGQGLVAACAACLEESACWRERRLQPLFIINDLLKVCPQSAVQLIPPLLDPLLARFAVPAASSGLDDCLAANRLAFWRLASRVAIAQPQLLLSRLPSAEAAGVLLSGWTAAAKRAAKHRDSKLLALGLLLYGFAALAAADASTTALDALFPDVVEAVLGVVVQCRREDVSATAEQPALAHDRGGCRSPEDEGSAADQSSHEVRKKLANAADCARRLSLLEHLRRETAALAAVVGPERMRRLADSLDSVTRGQLMELAAGASLT